MYRPIVEVALPVPLRRRFDYLWLTTAEVQPSPGMRVIVPFGSRQLIGVILQVKDTSEWDRAKLKAVRECLDETPVLNEEQRTLLHWASGYYQHPIGEVFSTALPAKLRKGDTNTRPSITYWKLTELGEQTEVSSLKRAPKQQQVLLALQKGATTELQLREQFNTAVLKQLGKKALIESEDIIPKPNTQWQSQLSIGDKPFASPAQAVIISAIKQQLSQFSVSLIEGVTGSGKTEVYLQAIEPVLSAGRQVLVMVPEIGLTPQTVSRFQDRFQIEVGVLHSGMTDNERLSVWQRAQNGELGLIIGTRSSVFTAFNGLGMIIIDEEHDSSYKQNDTFRYHARDLAIMRAKQENIPLLLGSATPSLESLHNALSKRYQHYQLHERAGNAVKANYHVLDLRQQPLQFGLAPETIKQMLHHLQQGNQVLVFLNRRGYAPALICHDCGHVETCRHCERPYTVHRQSQQLHCHHCGHHRYLPNQCQDCQSHDISPQGMGTEQLEQGLQTLFPQYSSVRIDSDTMRGKQNLNQTLESIHSGKHQLLLGTQILAKGHHFPNVTLVVVVDIDSALFSADFRGAEQLAQLITQIAGRAGRASKPGTVWLQSHHPGHPLIEDLIHNGYAHFSRLLLMERQYASLPPFSYQALLRAEAKHAEDAYSFLQAQLAPLRQTHGVIAIGPVPAILEKRQGRYRFQLVVQSPSRANLHAAIHHTLPVIESHTLAAKVRWSLDVDPQEFY
ncbi:primosomal protein N' [Alteromonas sp. a30]|uniref:primosomal protein N' n=1 Tax=Alteromonas sp. a30 TaxID=2730917 RepID=UPI00227E2C14|nr:primosomal protein N' [Alteromonas sp. a30]MCY7296666.1 primosomal protein N' [Alteromonas sp. a30]